MKLIGRSDFSHGDSLFDWTPGDPLPRFDGIVGGVYGMVLPLAASDVLIPPDPASDQPAPDGLCQCNSVVIVIGGPYEPGEWRGPKFMRWKPGTPLPTGVTIHGLFVQLP